jgi:hypothetical protein
MSKFKRDDTMVWLIAIGLLLFTGYRSMHLVSSTLPADAQVLAFAALLALDLGALGWLRFANGGARERQRGIAVLMIVVDLAGVTAAVVADTALIAAPEASRSLVETIALWAVPVIVAANVAATFAVTILDPERAKREAERVRLEEIEAAKREADEALQAAQREAELTAYRQQAARMRLRTAEQFSTNGRSEPVTLNADGVYPKGKSAANRKA